MKSINRRNFIRTSAIGVAGISITQNANAAQKSASETSNSEVITRKLGNTGIELPVLSMGVGRCDSPAVVRAALKLGVRHFDTAYVYQRGNSEKMLGEVLKDHDRNSFVISTKIKRTDTKEEFLELLDESLSRLQMDYVDILHLHAVSSREDLLNDEMVQALKMAKKSGKAKHLGVSTHKNEPEVIQAAIDSNVYEVVLSSVNFKQEHAAELKEKIALATQNGLGIIAMKVMAGGFLDKDKKMPVNYKAALKWILQDENVHTTIPSMINLEQLMDNSEILKDIKLSDEEKESVIIAQKEQGLFCNGCNQCVPSCKKQLPIPELMRAYMYTYGYGESLKAKELISNLNINDDPCGSCKVCTAACTKGFNISEKLSDINRLQNTPTEFLT